MQENRLAEIENILGDDYDLDRMKELVEADRESRVAVLPFNADKTFYLVCNEHIYRAHFLTPEMCSLIGKTLFFNCEDAYAKLKEQNKNGDLQ